MSLQDVHVAIYSNNVPEKPIAELQLLQLLPQLIEDRIDRKEVFLSVFKMHYGLCGHERHTLTQIAKQYGMSRSATRQCILKQLRQIRTLINCNKEP